jgi:hypothetical protein
MQEPFLINAPRRRRRRGRGGRFVSSRRGGRRRRRRNPDVLIANPRRRRRGSRRRSRRYRRNPGGLPGLGQLKGMAPKVGWGAVGVLGTEVVPGIASRFLPLPTGPVASVMVKAGSGLVTAWAIRRFVGRAQGNAAAVGALLAVAMDPIRGFILPLLGGIMVPTAAPVGAYLPDGVGAYLPDGGMGYLGPGASVAGFGDSMDVDRLSADSRL